MHLIFLSDQREDGKSTQQEKKKPWNGHPPRRRPVRQDRINQRFALDTPSIQVTAASHPQSNNILATS
jgi:hypothetical protein